MMLAGCAAPPVKVEPVFFPPPPNPAKVQFLKSINSSRDVEEEKSNFFLILQGASKEDFKPITKPYGITYNKGKLYVCDIQGLKVIIIDLINKKFDYLKGNVGYGQLKKPLNLAVGSDGNIYVADVVRKEVVMYDSAGVFIKTYGKGIVKKPVDVAVDDSSLYILDLADNDIKVVDLKSGDLERSIGSGEGKTPGLALPTNLSMDSKGYIYATNVGTSSVTKLDKDGHIISTFGKMGDSFGDFVRPKGITVDSQGRIFVVDGGIQNVQVFNENARLLMFFGNPPLKVGALDLPAGIATTTDNLDFYQKLAAPGFVVEEVIFVTNQQGASTISIYGLGHMEGAVEPPKEEKKSTVEPVKEEKKGAVEPVKEETKGAVEPAKEEKTAPGGGSKPDGNVPVPAKEGK
jgi:DNA-binding beta-propeller fold protein YncE